MLYGGEYRSQDAPNLGNVTTQCYEKGQTFGFASQTWLTLSFSTANASLELATFRARLVRKRTLLGFKTAAWTMAAAATI